MSEIILKKGLTKTEQKKVTLIIDNLTEHHSESLRLYEKMPNRYFCDCCNKQKEKRILFFN